MNDIWHCSTCGAYRDPQSLDYKTGMCLRCQDEGPPAKHDLGDDRKTELDFDGPEPGEAWVDPI